MTKIAFIRPNYPNEKRVALLPQDIGLLLESGVHPLVETGFGSSLNIPDDDYAVSGASIVSRIEAFRQNIIFSLKLIQPTDYHLLKFGHKIIGWMHPTGSGFDFYFNIAKNKKIQIIDLDSVYPRLYGDSVTDLDIEPKHFFWKNSMFAGIASIKLGHQWFNLSSSVQKSVAVLGSGSVSQGAFYELSRLGILPRMFYRKTLSIFYSSINQFDLIVNGIEVDSERHIMNRACIESTKKDCLIIDAAADAGRAIEGTSYNSLASPVSEVFGRRYILVNNAPTLLASEASQFISSVLAGGVLLQSLNYFL